MCEWLRPRAKVQSLHVVYPNIHIAILMFVSWTAGIPVILSLFIYISTCFTRGIMCLTYFTDQIHTYQTGRLTLVHVPSYVSGVGTKTKQGVIGIDEFPTSWISFGMIVNCVRRRPMFLPIYFIYWHHRPSKICPNSWPSLCLHPETYHCRLYTC